MIFPQETMKQEGITDIISMTASSPYGIIIIKKKWRWFSSSIHTIHIFSVTFHSRTFVEETFTALIRVPGLEFSLVFSALLPTVRTVP